MMFNVPQFIDLEDKIAFGMSWRQIGWMGACLVILIILWQFLTLTPFIVVAVVLIALFAAFAFYRPYGVTLLKFVFFSILYLFGSKNYVWFREVESIIAQSTQESPKKNKKKSKKKKSGDEPQTKTLSISEMADLLDNPER